ncbi:MAG TPA: hypothetical protein VIY48_19545, partial [Candidatus Paceibacterota bacterium]
AANGSGGSGVPNPAANGLVACTGTNCSTASARTISAGAGLAGSNLDGVSGNPTLTTASDEADFIKSGTLTCGASTQGKAEVDAGLFRVCDNSATPAVLIMANGDASGKALAGDSATAFFASGTIESARLPAALADSTSINGLGITASAGGSLTITPAKAFQVGNSITLAGTDSTTMTFPTTNATIARTDAGQTFTGTNTVALGTSSTGVTQSQGNNSTALATTAYVDHVIRYVEVELFPPGTATATGDGKAYFRIPAGLNGMNLVSVKATVYTAGTTNVTNIDIDRCAAAATGNVCSGTVSDMLSTNMTIDSGENDTATAATAAVIDTANDDVSTGQILRFNVDAISTTPAQGLLVECGFQLP